MSIPGIGIGTGARIFIDVGDGTAFPSAAHLAAYAQPRPGDTATRNEGIAVCFQHFPDLEVLLDDGYLGLSRDHRGQAVTPPVRELCPGDSSNGNASATNTPPTASPSNTPSPTANAGSNSRARLTPRPPAQDLPRHRQPGISPYRGLETGHEHARHISPAVANPQRIAVQQPVQAQTLWALGQPAWMRGDHEVPSDPAGAGEAARGEMLASGSRRRWCHPS